ncbi:MAG: Wzz/FepE/Etk N-terminal domain-containing protein [Oscillospiraceae bacterium]
MEQEYETIDLREIFYLLKNNIILIIISVFACSAIGFLVTVFFITPQYEASATLIVNNRADQSAVITYDQINSAKQLVGTYAIILKSDTVLDKVISNMRLNTIKGMEDIDAVSLAKMVEVVGVDTTQVIRISVKNPDPEIAKGIVQEIVNMAPENIVNTIKAGSVEIISAPRALERPVSPSKKMNTLVAALIGLIASVGFVLLKDMLNNTFTSDTDIQKQLELTVLGVIPSIDIEE